MSLTTRVLLGLIAGLAFGIALASGVLPESWRVVAAWTEPVGTLWTRALQMTVLPLVVTLLFTGVSSGGRGLGTLGVKGMIFFLVTLGGVAALTLTIAPVVFGWLPIEPIGPGGLGGEHATAVPDVPSFRDWLVALIPSNLLAAAASGAMLPVITATLIFGAGANRLPEETRSKLVHAAEAIGAVTITVVRGILSLAPIGVFALAVPLALRLGTTALGAVAAYVAVTAGISLLTIALCYPLVALRGMSIGRFARALAPAQGIAVSARSSLAALPALIDGATDLGMSDRVTGFFLPFSASLYRLGGAVALPVGVLFIARLYDVPLGPTEFFTIGITSVLLTFSVPGIPGGSILIMAPVLLAVGLPVEGIGILLGVDTIPDMFRTTANVTGTMAAGVILETGDQAGPGS